MPQFPLRFIAGALMAGSMVMSCAASDSEPATSAPDDTAAAASQETTVEDAAPTEPAIAPSGLLVYRGDRFPQWQGDLFAGGLVSQDVRYLDVDESGAVVNEIPIAIGQRVRDVREGPDGLIYVLTDEPNGRLVRLEPG